MSVFRLNEPRQQLVVVFDTFSGGAPVDPSGRPNSRATNTIISLPINDSQATALNVQVIEQVDFAITIKMYQGDSLFCLFGGNAPDELVTREFDPILVRSFGSLNTLKILVTGRCTLMLSTCFFTEEG